MAKLVKKVTRQIEEELDIADCPVCCGDIQVSDCGYSTFNPGMAKCLCCSREWTFSCVRDAWEVGELWNELAKKITADLVQINVIEKALFHYDGCHSSEFNVLLGRFKAFVISGK